MNQLQNIIQQETLRLTTAFASQSFLKARIQKLGQAQSWRWAGLKFVLVLPILLLCVLWAFSFYQPSSLFPVEKKGKIGFMNEKGELVIPFQILKYNYVSNKYLILAKERKDWTYWGVMNHLGKIMIPFEYDEIAEQFSEGLIAVRKNEKCGFLNEKGETVIPFEYDYAGSFRYGLAPVRLGNKRGFIDKNNKIVIPLIYHKAFHFSENLLRVETYPDYEQLLINHKNEVVKKLPYYYQVLDLQNNRAQVRIDGLAGFINEKGEEVIPLVYSTLQTSQFYEGLIGAMKDDKFGYIDENGKEVIPFQYRFGNEFSEGLAAVCVVENQQWKYGFIDKSGKTIIPFEYEQVTGSFREGLVAVQKNKKWGIINQKGEIVVPFIYDYMNDFQNGLAQVQKGKRTFYIDKNGNEVKVKK